MFRPLPHKHIALEQQMVTPVQVTSSCVTVTVNQALNATALSDQAICPEDMAQISAAGTGGNGGPYNYVWDQGVGAGSNQTVSPSGTTIYTVSVTDGCETPAATASVTITIYPYSGYWV